MLLDIWEIVLRLDLYQDQQDMTAKDYYDAKPAWCLVEKFDLNLLDVLMNIWLTQVSFGHDHFAHVPRVLGRDT